MGINFKKLVMQQICYMIAGIMALMSAIMIILLLHFLPFEGILSRLGIGTEISNIDKMILTFLIWVLYLLNFHDINYLKDWIKLAKKNIKIKIIKAIICFVWLFIFP